MACVKSDIKIFQNNCFIYFKGSTLKITKNAFYLIAKDFFVLDI